MGNRSFLRLSNIAAAILVTALISLCSCSQSGPIAPDGTSTAPLRAAENGRVLLGLWEINLGVIDDPCVEAVHAGAIHFNVLDLLIPPKCDDCLAIAINGFFPSQHRLEADVTLKNKEDLTGYDVRGIMISDVGHDLYNADDYTDLWDNGGAVGLNPFKRFPPDPGPYIFYPYSSETAHYSLKTPVPHQLGSLMMAVDASWPASCGEPFNMGANGKEVWGELNENGGMLHCYVDVFTHQKPIESVRLDLTAIGGAEIELMKWTSVPGLSNFYAAFDIPFAGHAAGEYDLWFKSRTTGPNLWLYDKISVELLPSGKVIPRLTVCEVNPYPFSLSNVKVKDGHLYALGAGSLKIYGIGIHGDLALEGEVGVPAYETDRYFLFLGEGLAYGYIERWEYFESKLLVFDTSDPANPQSRGIMETVPILGGGVVKDNYFICTIPSWQLIATVDATDPDNPHIVEQMYIDNIPWACALDGDLLFVIHSGKGVGVYGVSNPLSLNVKGSLAWNKVMDTPLALAGKKGYMWGVNGELGIFSYETNPSYPKLVSQVVIKDGWTGDTISGFYIDGDYLYAWGETCYVIDKSDSLNPSLVFEPSNPAIAPATSQGIAFHGRYAYAPQDSEMEFIRSW